MAAWPCNSRMNPSSIGDITGGPAACEIPLRMAFDGLYAFIDPGYHARAGIQAGALRRRRLLCDLVQRPSIGHAAGSHLRLPVARGLAARLVQRRRLADQRTYLRRWRRFGLLGWRPGCGCIQPNALAFPSTAPTGPGATFTRNTAITCRALGNHSPGASSPAFPSLWHPEAPAFKGVPLPHWMHAGRNTARPPPPLFPLNEGDLRADTKGGPPPPRACGAREGAGWPRRANA